MLWRLPFCRFNRHRANPLTVRWNGTHYIGQCRDCRGAVRKSSRGYWKRQEDQAKA